MASLAALPPLRPHRRRLFDFFWRQKRDECAKSAHFRMAAIVRHLWNCFGSDQVEWRPKLICLPFAAIFVAVLLFVALLPVTRGAVKGARRAQCNWLAAAQLHQGRGAEVKEICRCVRSAGTLSLHTGLLMMLLFAWQVPGRLKAWKVDYCCCCCCSSAPIDK